MIPLKDNWKLPFSFIELWRNMNRMARWLNGMQLEGGQVIHNENGMRLVPGFSDVNYPWKVTVTQTGPTTYSANTQQGRWTRNTDIGNTSLTLASPSVEPITDGHYFIAVIYRATNPFSKDARLFPTAIGVTSISATDKASVLALGAFAGGELATYNYGGHVVLGKLTAGVWAQHWKGGDITDALEIGDGNSLVPTDPHTKTIERCPSGAHEFETQMQNVDAAQAESYSVPYIPKNAAGSGELAWAVIDTHEPSPAGQSLEVAIGRAQIRNWQMTPTAFAEGTHDALLGRIITTNEAVLLTPDSLPYNGPPTDMPWPTNPTFPDPPYVPPTDEPWPTNPDDLSHHVLIDLEANDDHGGISTAAKGAYVQLIGAATRNAMSGVIGDGSGVQSIDPTARTLDGAGGGSFGWKVTSDNPISVDDFETGALVVAGSVSIGVDLQVDRDVFADRLWISSAADAVPYSSIITTGGLFAGGHVRARAGFGNGTKDGISKNVSWEDVNGQVHTLEISGGIITDHTVA
jgi:hypothetical protein